MGRFICGTGRKKFEKNLKKGVDKVGDLVYNVDTGSRKAPERKGG